MVKNIVQTYKKFKYFVSILQQINSKVVTNFLTPRRPTIFTWKLRTFLWLQPLLYCHEFFEELHFLKSSPTNEEGNRGEEMKWSTLVPHITKTFNWRALLPCWEPVLSTGREYRARELARLETILNKPPLEMLSSFFLWTSSRETCVRQT